MNRSAGLRLSFEYLQERADAVTCEFASLAIIGLALHQLQRDDHLEQHEHDTFKPDHPYGLPGKLYVWSLRDVLKWIMRSKDLPDRVIDLAKAVLRAKGALEGIELCDRLAEVAAVRIESLRVGENVGTQPALSNEDRAIALLRKNPELKIKQIAEDLGVNRSTIYRWRNFMPAFKAVNAPGALPPTGSIDEDGRIEAKHERDHGDG